MIGKDSFPGWIQQQKLSCLRILFLICLQILLQKGGILYCQKQRWQLFRNKHLQLTVTEGFTKASLHLISKNLFSLYPGNGTSVPELLPIQEKSAILFVIIHSQLCLFSLKAGRQDQIISSVCFLQKRLEGNHFTIHLRSECKLLQKGSLMVCPQISDPERQQQKCHSTYHQ